MTKREQLVKINKQGPCGAFCFKYWLGGGCDDCIDMIKRINKL